MYIHLCMNKMIPPIFLQGCHPPGRARSWYFSSVPKDTHYEEYYLLNTNLVQPNLNKFCLWQKRLCFMSLSGAGLGHIHNWKYVSQSDHNQYVCNGFGRADQPTQERASRVPIVNKRMLACTGGSIYMSICIRQCMHYCTMLSH